MEEGIRTSFDEFINMQVDHDHEAAQRQIEAVERGMQEAEEQRKKQAQLEQQWRELGGRR
jgi:chemotaxis regulatin CheY-phosphate phosphatase CheZ